MRVLLLTWNFPPTIGGIEYVAAHLFHGLAAAGSEVEVVTRAAPGAPDDPRIHRARRAGLPAFLFHALRRGAASCRRWRPDLVVCASVVAALPAYLLRRAFGIPYVVLVHGSDVLHPGRLYRRAVRFLLRGAGAITANSEGTRRLLIDFGIAADRVVVVHPGVEAWSGSAEVSPAWLPRLAGRQVLLSVGRLIRRKGLLEFIEQVLPDLRVSHPGILLVVVGEDAAESLIHRERMRERLDSAVRARGLADQVLFTGGLPDAELHALLRRADLFVLPAIPVPGDVEGFGIVFLEAALEGTPAVATRLGGIPEAVVDGETGLLVEPGDPRAMLEAVRRLLDDDRLRARLGDAARRRAREDFAWSVVVARYVRVFEDCVRRQRS